MQDQKRDTIITEGGIIKDYVNLQQPLFIESRPSTHYEFKGNFHSGDLSRNNISDWYFIVIIIVLSGIAWARIFYGKFLTSILISAYNYQSASKIYEEQSVIQKRFSLGLDFLYLINASLFLFLLNRYFAPVNFNVSDIIIVFGAFLFLSGLVLLRNIVMRLTAFIFNQSELFLAFLYHYFIFNKVLGILLIPFLVAIPYTQGFLQEMIIYTGVSMVIVTLILRLVRVAIFVLKNVVLLFYLILYLCILEILPLLVVIKLLLSLVQV